ncbi:MAG: ATP-grasp domain-containing protein [Oscillospiraceae bacterium]|nr:ATP-grasp domain-containing protein [Oscillospiraceae bacterium]
MKKIYVGPKQTTIENSDFFNDSITLFKDKANFDYWNPDTNPLQILLYNERIAKLTESTEIMAHNPRLVNECVLPEYVHQICKNSMPLLEILDDKNQTHKLMQNIVPMLDYYIIRGQDFDYCKLCDISKELVVQLPVGSGGSKTYLVNNNNYKQIKLISDCEYSLSAYQRDNVSYNIHCVINSEQIEIFAPSKQELEISNIIEYMGNDFEIDISNDVKNKLIQYSTNICKKIQSMGYLGVVGIDFIYANGELYFIEINPRFQGSSRQLDALLKESNLPSIFDYNYRAFNVKEMPIAKDMLLSIF